MRTSLFASIAALGVTDVLAHATFQDLWINGADYISDKTSDLRTAASTNFEYGAQCVRLPLSNSPVTTVTSNDIRCNAGTSPVAGKCVVKAGDTVTVEMHQQPGDRTCTSEAIGGAHYGPLMAYMTKVSDASTADGSSGWFKIFQDSWAHNATGASGDDDFWGTKDLNTCCGKMNVKIPSDIAPGDYLLRAEVIALHTASSSGGAQFYMSCYQLTVSGSGTAAPSTVLLPGAYSASDPGILVNIHASMSTYIAPGPTVYSGGSTKSAGSGCSGCESTCTPGSGATGTATSATKATSTTLATSTTTGSGGSSGCSVAKYGQCGGSGYTGCTTCASGSSCSKTNDYYSQCL